MIVLYQFVLGSPCTLTHNKLRGTCKLAQHCPKVISDFKFQKIAPTVCGWTQNLQIVCCQNEVTATVANLSKSEKCKNGILFLS